MDKRSSLLLGTKLKLINPDGQSCICVIEKEIGRGASCIVYEGAYYANTGDKKLVRIKECYPYNLQINRNHDGSLIPADSDRSEFNKQKAIFAKDFSLTNSLFFESGLYDSIVNNVDIYDFNNSKYIVSSYSTSDTLAKKRPKTIKNCVDLVCQVAKIIRKIHEAGYLYIDVKPDNILYIDDGVQNRIQLFDFNSLIPYSFSEGHIIFREQEHRLSYSRGFSAVELQLSRKECIGPATDVFGIGALLYYLLSGTTPNALHCENDASFSESDFVLSFEDCDDKMLPSITDFFHNSLACYYLDRYQTMDEVISQLMEISTYADQEKKRVFSSRLYKEEYFVGRESEVRKIDEWLSGNDNRCMFITGMGGIGKSTLVRQYIYSKHEQYTCIYLVYSESIKNTINDDFKLRINKVQRADVEKEDEYYKRKLLELRNLDTESTILVIDNFEGEIDKDFLALLEFDWKLIVVSRKSKLLRGAVYLKIDRIFDSEELHLLFEAHLGRKLGELEYPLVDRLIDSVDGHTLILELIAKQIVNSHISIAQAVELVVQNGFSGISLEKVDYEKDSQPYEDTISNIINALFKETHLSKEKRTILKTVSVLGIKGLPLQQLSEWMGWESLQAINELRRDGWIEVQDNIKMHPVIRETIARWKWNDEDIEAIQLLLFKLDSEIWIETSINDYPAALKQDLDNLQKKYNQKTEKIIKKKAHNSPETMFVLCKRIERLRTNAPRNNIKVLELLGYAREVIENCGRIEILRQDDYYLKLLYRTVLNTPAYDEAYILAKTDHDINQLIEDKGKNNPVSIIKLLKMAASIYATRGEYDVACAKIDKAKNIVKKLSSCEAKAHYYDMLSEYYDILLAGAYDAESEEEKKILLQLKKSISKCRRIAKRIIQRDGSHLYIQNTLAEITISIRTNRAKQKQIDKALRDVEKLLERYTLEYASVRFQFYMVYAWYSAIMLEDPLLVQGATELASELYEKIGTNDLERVDVLIIPMANIYMEIRDYCRSIRLLLIAYEVCNNHSDVEIYQTKAIEVFNHLLDVVSNKDKATTHLILGWIEESLAAGSQLPNIQKVILQKLKEYIE